MRKLLINLLIGMGAIVLLSACKTVPPQVNSVNKDSVFTKTEIVYRDTIITLPGDTIRFQVPCDKDTVFIYKGKSSSSMVAINNGKITVQNNCDEKDLIISKLRQQVERIHFISSDSTKVITITVKHVPGIMKFFTWGFWVILALLAGLILVNKNLWVILASTLLSIFKLFKKKK